MATAKKELKALQRSNFSDADRVIKLSKNVTTYHARVAKGLLGAPLETAAELQAISSALTDIKQEALLHVGGAAADVDREKIQQEARDEFLQEILNVLENALSPGCYASAREALVEEFGEE